MIRNPTLAAQHHGTQIRIGSKYRLSIVIHFFVEIFHVKCRLRKVLSSQGNEVFLFWPQSRIGVNFYVQDSSHSGIVMHGTNIEKSQFSDTEDYILRAQETAFKKWPRNSGKTDFTFADFWVWFLGDISSGTYDNLLAQPCHLFIWSVRFCRTLLICIRNVLFTCCILYFILA